MDNAADIMNPKVVCVDKNKSLLEIVNIISLTNISSVVITDEGRPIGIVTERDLIKKIVSQNVELLKRTKPKEIMGDGELITITKTARLNDIHELMNKKQIRHLPVVENGYVVGIVSHGDVAQIAHILNSANIKFMRYQNVQTAIIIAFFALLIIVLIYKFIQGTAI